MRAHVGFDLAYARREPSIPGQESHNVGNDNVRYVYFPASAPFPELSAMIVLITGSIGLAGLSREESIKISAINLLSV